MAVKLKRGRLWFIACRTPIPYPPKAMTTTRPRPGTVRVNMAPTLRPMKQPLYDSKGLDSIDPMPPRSLFQNDAIGEYGYYWGTDDNEDVVWRSNWENAIGYDTREEAEARAFDVVLKYPHLIGKLIVMKLKVRLGT